MQVVKSRALNDLASVLVPASSVTKKDEAWRLAQLCAGTEVVCAVGVSEYRSVVEEVVRGGDCVLEVGCHMGTSTKILAGGTKCLSAVLACVIASKLHKPFACVCVIAGMFACDREHAALVRAVGVSDDDPVLWQSVKMRKHALKEECHVRASTEIFARKYICICHVIACVRALVRRVESCRKGLAGTRMCSSCVVACQYRFALSCLYLYHMSARVSVHVFVHMHIVLVRCVNACACKRAYLRTISFCAREVFKHVQSRSCLFFL